jgi:hypothetical protein
MSDRVSCVKTEICLLQAFLFESQVKEFIAEFWEQKGADRFCAQKILFTKRETNGTKGMVADDPPAGRASSLDNPTIHGAARSIVPDPLHSLEQSRPIPASACGDLVDGFVKTEFIAAL